MRLDLIYLLPFRVAVAAAGVMATHHLDPRASSGSVRPSKRSRTSEDTDTESSSDGSAFDELGLSLSLAETLGFGTVEDQEGHADDDDDGHSLLELVLSYLCTSADLLRTRSVCRPFLRCSDKIAEYRIPTLLGPHIRPMVGQTTLGLLHGAEAADETTLHHVTAWDGKIGRAAGFDVGLPTTKPKDSKWNVMATVSGDERAPNASLPFYIKFGTVVMTLEGDAIVRRRPPEIIAPNGFFHASVYKHSARVLGGRVTELTYDHGLNDILIRIREALADPGLAHGLNSDADFLRQTDAVKGTHVYDECSTMFLRFFDHYRLGNPMPNLRPLNEFVRLKICELELIRRRDLQASQANGEANT